MTIPAVIRCYEELLFLGILLSGPNAFANADANLGKAFDYSAFSPYVSRRYGHCNACGLVHAGLKEKHGSGQKAAIFCSCAVDNLTANWYTFVLKNWRGKPVQVWQQYVLVTAIFD